MACPGLSSQQQLHHLRGRSQQRDAGVPLERPVVGVRRQSVGTHIFTDHTTLGVPYYIIITSLEQTFNL